MASPETIKAIQQKYQPIKKTSETGDDPVVRLPDGDFAYTDGKGTILDIFYAMPGWVETPLLDENDKQVFDKKGKPKTIWMR